MNGDKDMERSMDWREAWRKWSSLLRNQTNIQKTRGRPKCDTSLFLCFFQQEMVISVFCESQRERKLFKWASNCGLEEMPCKKSGLNFPLTSQYTQHVSTKSQNINILLDFECPSTGLHIASACPLPGILCDSWQKHKWRPYTVAHSPSFPHLLPSSTTNSLSHMEWTPTSIHILSPKQSPLGHPKWVKGNTAA